MRDLDLVVATQPPAKPLASLSTEAKLSLCAVFIQAWLVLLHFRLAGHDSANVRVVGQAFDLMRESTIPSAFAALQALFASVIAGAMAGKVRHMDTKRRWIGWLSLMAVFFIIAADDAGAIHERINAIVSLQLVESLHYPSYPWHVVLVPFFAIALLVPLWAIRSDLAIKPSQQVALGMALVCYALALAFDFAEGWEMMTRVQGDPIPAQLVQMMVAEEILEMIGTTLFVYVFLTTLLHNLPQQPLSLLRLTNNTTSKP